MGDDLLGLGAVRPIGWTWTDINGDTQVNWSVKPDCDCEPIYSKAALERVLAHGRSAVGTASDFHAKNNALRLELLDMREVMLRLIAGVDHLSAIARLWEPDHSSGAERRGWLLANDAADDAKKLLDSQPERLPAINRGDAMGDGAPFGIIDPDYARIFTQARVVAWQYGYSCCAQGSFTRDLDLLLVPWTENATVPVDALIAHLADVTGTKSTGAPSDKPHGRKAWTLLLPGFTEVRWVDVSVFPRCAKVAHE